MWDSGSCREVVDLTKRRVPKYDNWAEDVGPDGSREDYLGSCCAWEQDGIVFSCFNSQNNTTTIDIIPHEKSEIPRSKVVTRRKSFNMNVKGKEPFIQIWRSNVQDI